MMVKIEKRKVNVLDEKCPKRPCFSLYFDKGSYTPGRGYTSYYRDAKGDRVEHPVCGTRFFRGCPSNSVCPLCRRGSVEPIGTPCAGPKLGSARWEPCGGVTEALTPTPKENG